MNKMGKRFVALTIVFASIMSFLPIKFGSNGQAVNAMTTQIKVSGTATTAGDNVAIINGEYSTQEMYKDFTIAVDNKIIDNIDNIGIGQTGVTAQEVIIKSIDGVKLDGVDLVANNSKLAVIGASISAGNIPYIENNTIGATITGLPYGVNKIEYQVKETTVFNKGKAVTDSNGKVTMVDDRQTAIDSYFPSSQTTKEIIIQHANNFVQKKINPMVFDSYVGDIKEYDENDTSSKVPFLFSENGVYNDKCPLRYNFKVSDAVSTLKYTMNFDPTVPIDSNTSILKNGVVDNSITIGNKSISGYLRDLGGSDLIVVKLSDDLTNVGKAYSIQLEYSTLSTPNDYTLRDAGILKYNYNADSAIKAYVGKKFDVKTENGAITYMGNITIDKKAGMIGMQPLIGRSPNLESMNSSNTAYKISNHYDNGRIEASKLMDNGSGVKSYVNFAKGISNEIWLEVYQGKDGNITGPLLAVYKLKVNFVENSEATPVIFKFGDLNNSVILTQPGRSKATDAISFTESRRTYDLHSDFYNIPVELTNPTGKGEYIKVWGGTSVQSDTVTELNDLSNTSAGTIDVTNYKKILLQAYYDEIVYKKDNAGNLLTDANGNNIIESKTPYAIGPKYTFYITKNAGTPDSNGETTSSNASLSNIIADNGNIKATDGTSGFSNDKVNYNVTVPKTDTSSKITVTTGASNVKDITATIMETGDEYGLTSGEGFDFPLYNTGTTNIKIVVTAQDGITSKEYNVTINNDTRSASALLKNVITDNGDFTFDPDEDLNKIRVDQAINKLKVSPVAEDSNSKITVNGEKFSGTPITIDLRGSQETEMEIKVTSEDGSYKKTYNFKIYRTDTELDDEDDDDTDESDVFYDEIDDCWVDTSKYEEWGVVKGKAVYFNKSGRQVKEQWINTKGTWYYLNSKGYKTSGWRKEVGGKSYYLDSTTGAVKTGWMNQNNKWYYLGANGVMQKGWLYLNNKWYYFTPEGEMITNQSMFVNDKVYNFAQDGSIY